MDHVYLPTELLGKPTPLAACSFLKLRSAKGYRIVCASGVLLATVSGDYREFELHAPGAFVVPGNGIVLIEAIGDASVVLQKRVLPRARWLSGIATWFRPGPVA